MSRALRRIEGLAGSGPDGDLAAWAARVAVPEGDLPLLGAGVRAAAYVALLWNGDRCRRAQVGRGAALTLVGLAVGAEHGRDAASLVRAVRPGLAVADALDQWLYAAETPLALPTTDVVAAATCAALLAGTPRDDLPKLLDMSGSLMVITPPCGEGVSADIEGAWAGHALAAGWLATRAWTSGLVGFNGGLAYTLSVVTGRSTAPTDPSAPQVRALLDQPPADVGVRSLVEALG